jgi:hypothetical protein
MKTKRNKPDPLQMKTYEQIRVQTLPNLRRVYESESL